MAEGELTTEPLSSAGAFVQAFTQQPLATTWLLLSNYGWHLLGAAALLYWLYSLLRPQLKQLHERVTALPEVKVDEDKLVAARARMQAELNRKSQEAKEKREAQRRAEILEGKEKPKLKHRPSPDDGAPRAAFSAAAWGLDGDSRGGGGAGGGGGARRFGRQPPRGGG